jgi:hypothetical protein
MKMLKLRDDDWRNKNDFPKGVGLFAGGFTALFIVGLLVSLGFTGVIIWAIIMLVNHFAG